MAPYCGRGGEGAEKPFGDVCIPQNGKTSANSKKILAEDVDMLVNAMQLQQEQKTVYFNVKNLAQTTFRLTLTLPGNTLCKRSGAQSMEAASSV